MNNTMNRRSSARRSSNPWTANALANDYHLGSRSEARLIAAENGDDHMTCGACGATAWYRHTVGSFQCTTCRSVLLTGPAPEFKQRWS